MFVLHGTCVLVSMQDIPAAAAGYTTGYNTIEVETSHARKKVLLDVSQ